MNSDFSCVIVGAGIAGLMAAQTLQAQGVRVTVLDKGRGVGGRLATRWVEVSTEQKAYFDHGAQFFTVRDQRFQKFVDEWMAAGIVRQWSSGFAQSDGILNNDGHPRYCGTTGMNSIARHLTNGIDVRTNAKVIRVVQQNSQWKIVLENDESLTADALLLTPPAEQSLALLDETYSLPIDVRDALERITYDPCFALLAVLNSPPRLPDPGALQLQSEPITWMADNYRKGISPNVFTATIHAGAEFTREHWDANHEIIAQKLLSAAQEWLGDSVQSWQVHRWRYSQPRVLHPEACLIVNDGAPLAFAGDGFGAARVEGAAISGISAAEKIVALLHEKK
jgi:renalase